MNDYIYHYTSIETLALILKNKSIRFNSLKNVDDINETEFSDENDINFSSHVFISCWTNKEIENLAFWNMYTPNMKGVRIKLPKDIFEKYSFITTNIEGMQNNTFINGFLISKEECFNENYWIIPFTDDFYSIKYTDDHSLLKPSIYKKFGDQFNVKLGEIGKYKSKIWEFQSEVRFRLFIFPCKDLKGNTINPLIDFERIMHDNIPPPIENYFINIKNEIFQKMEITLGPKCSLSEEIIVESLIQKYNPNALIFKNKLSDLIK